ncbi:uncharacterized protein LOC125236946 [Leguminivora glycinivorella]|uniref:uncharacterized protein LOC125236946 n=1 Tax=Leguminivora glycinivorella TaxID=1035111 RepID=UPI00200FAE86|nr:uncharacterized protein LOC125236946 [Leguminivora glycinivorella]
MRLSSLLCLFVVFSLSQARRGRKRDSDEDSREDISHSVIIHPNGTIEYKKHYVLLSAKKTLNDLANRPQRLTGSKTKKSEQEARKIAGEAKKLFAKTVKKVFT